MGKWNEWASINGSQLVIGLGEGENFIGSDVSAIMEYTRNILYLDDGEVAEITKDEFNTWTETLPQLYRTTESSVPVCIVT